MTESRDMKKLYKYLYLGTLKQSRKHTLTDTSTDCIAVVTSASASDVVAKLFQVVKLYGDALFPLDGRIKFSASSTKFWITVRQSDSDLHSRSQISGCDHVVEAYRMMLPTPSPFHL